MESTTVLVASRTRVTHGVRARSAGGFTLIEMLVVLAIISIITSLSVLGQSTFNQKLLLTNTAYTVGFSAREAQTFGLSSRKFGSVQNAGYGLHFDRSQPNSYILFADISNILPFPPSPIPLAISPCPTGSGVAPDIKYGNCVYDSAQPSPDSIVEKFSFSRGFKVLSFCGSDGSVKTCSTSASPLSTLDIVFTRPNTAGVISGTVSGVTYGYSCAEITLADSQNAAQKSIRVSNLGEVSVGQTCP